LLQEYSANKRLIGHGVRYSMFDAKWTKRQSDWLSRLKKEVKKYQYNHITEHFGFMSNTDFHKGAPMPVPLNKSSLAIGIDRLKRMSAVAGVPVGIENLAFSFSAEDVKKQGLFLQKLVQPVNGFLILDLHNIYCQSKNFRIGMLKIIRAYPLKKVKEIHISGGSWQQSIYSTDLQKVRRDTHDGQVPEEIFKILPKVLKLCTNLEYIIFERMGNTMQDENEQLQFRKDFLRIKSVAGNVSSSASKRNGRNNWLKPRLSLDKKPITDSKLLSEQQHILEVMRTTENPYDALNKLNKEKLKDWQVLKWKPSMVETAIQLIRKWD
ncbi:MAG: DUF692 family protein, partial [Bacteroidia bacterium]|nr:DUF692 family protein [Bacteroidia bacterium]